MNNITKINTKLPALAMSEDELMSVLRSSIYVGAKDESIKMAVNYCKAAGLDIMQKPVHLVPMWDSKRGEMRDVVMPGIGLYRTQASRSGEMAGIDEPIFGEDITESFEAEDYYDKYDKKNKKRDALKVIYPKWCKVTVRKLMLNGMVAEYHAKELWKENYATQSKDSEHPNAMWKRRPYAQLAKCFDEKTEILTSNGFEKFSEVTGNILQVTNNGLEECDAKPFVQDYLGEMIVASGTRLNFSVTPNHDMLTSKGKIEAIDLFEQATTDSLKLSIPKAVYSNKVDDNSISDIQLELAGYFLADGSHSGYNQFRIAVSRPYKIEALKELNLHENESIKQDAGREAMLASGRVIKTNFDKTSFTYQFSLIEQLVSKDKLININRLLNMSSRQARLLVDSMIEFDGSDNGNGVRRFHQTNKNVLNSFEVAAVHAGYSISKRFSRKDGDGITVTISDSSNFPVVKGLEKNKSSLVKRLNVGGKVWCVSVPSGLIVVRREGFSMLCGNCAEAQALRKAFPELGAMPTAEEMEGKEIDVTPQSTQPKPKTYVSDDDFNANMTKWKTAVENGKKTDTDLIIWIEAKGSELTQEQSDEIKSWVIPPVPQTVENEVIQASDNSDFLSDYEAGEQNATA